MIQHLSLQDVDGGTPPVAVVVVNWNRRALLEACLRSLESPQEVAFEVLVVDNGSADGSVEFLESYAASAPFPLRWIVNPVNRGFCAANNQGFAATRSPFIALLNNDAEAKPGWLGGLYRAFDSPRVGMAASKILVWEDPQIIDKAGHLIWLDGQNRGRGSGELDQGQYDHDPETLWPDGCACMYRRAMLDEAGGFDEDLFAYGDDAELGLRARIAGWTCRYAPEAVVLHHRGSTLGVVSYERLFLIERNRVLLAVKLFPGRLLWLNVVYFLARILAGARAAWNQRGEISQFPSWSAKLRAGLTILRADWAALRWIPRMWRKRRALEPIRRLTPREVEQLLRRHTISLRALSEQTAVPHLRAQ